MMMALAMMTMKMDHKEEKVVRNVVQNTTLVPGCTHVVAVVSLWVVLAMMVVQAMTMTMVLAKVDCNNELAKVDHKMVVGCTKVVELVVSLRVVLPVLSLSPALLLLLLLWL